MAAYCRPPGGAGGGGRYGDAELDDYDGSGEDDGSEGDECAQGNAQFSGRPYVPPASSAAGTGPSFGENMESHFLVPRRLQDKPYELIEAANDWHYAMMNDIPRNEFYLSALQQLVSPKLLSQAPGADETLAARQATDLVLAALEVLDDDRRSLFVLHELDGVSMPEVAAALSIPLNTAYSRLRLALEQKEKEILELKRLCEQLNHAHESTCIELEQANDLVSSKTDYIVTLEH